jgi:competence protein ComEC
LNLKPRQSWIAGLAVNLIFINMGMLIINMFQSGNMLITDISKEFWVGEVINDAQLKNKYARFEMAIFPDSGSSEKVKVQVVVQAGNSFSMPQAGQIIVLKTRPERIQKPMNPGEFDYAAYLENLGIRYKCFVKEGEWKVLAMHKKFSISVLAIQAKKRLWEKIENMETGNKNLGVLYALSLGSKELLTPEIREAYTITGVMHVLVVSGQHIALIWMVLSYIFIWVKNIRGGKFIQFFLISGLIWFYTFMTGITASVVRASGMFTLVSLGKIIQKESSIYNSLSVSAFFGLIFCPQWLIDPGFQLSYIAVLSIVFFQPKVISLWTPRSWILQKIWDIASVSIAAQIGTLPLTLFYFNRFPPWFIISNILAIPLVTIIMILFIIMLIFWMIPVIFSILLKIILFLIGIMNASLYFIETLPSPGVDMIYLSNFQMICFVLIILGITFFIRYRKNYYFFMGLTMLLLLVSSGTLRKFESLDKTEMVLFSVPGNMILGLIEGSKGIFLHNAIDTKDIKGNFDFKCKPFLIQNEISHSEISGLFDSLILKIGFRKIPGNENYFFSFAGKSILVLNDPVFYNGMRSSIILQPDILIINNRIPKIWKGQVPLFYTNHLLISSSVPKYYQFKTGETGIIHTDSIFDTRVLGAFRQKLKHTF